MKAVTESQLSAWAHEGTVESVEKIRAFIDKTEDEELRGYAELAYGEALYLAYSPTNDEEERDFLLGRMIFRNETRMCDLFMQQMPLERLVAQGEVDHDVHEVLMKGASESERETWKYNYSPDYYVCEQGKLKEVQAEIAYIEAWLKQAKKMFKIDKYRTAPVEVYENIHDDGEEPEDEKACACRCSQAIWKLIVMRRPLEIPINIMRANF